jgi:hypothetical protein
MKRNTLKRWIEACLVGSLVAGGCNRQEVPLAKNDGGLVPPASALAQRDPKPATVKHSDSVLVATSYVAPDQTREMSAKEKRPAAELPPVVFADPSTSLTMSMPAPKPLPAETMAAALPANLKAPAKVTVQDEPVAGASRFGHALDYSWVCGEVQRTRKGWHLRYAGVDETDTYGGSVMLSDDSRLVDLKEGEVFVVKGHLQSPDAHTSAPVYVVSDVKSQSH